LHAVRIPHRRWAVAARRGESGHRELDCGRTNDAGLLQEARAHQRLLREFLAHHLHDARPMRAFDMWERRSSAEAIARDAREVPDDSLAV
jgi:hypothetical protein